MTTRKTESSGKGLAIVTGADGGMGTIHTKTLLEAGYDVIMACYDTAVALPVFEQMDALNSRNVYLMQVDLGDLHSVKRFADEVKSQFNSIRIILNNAGVLCHYAKRSVDGYEYTVAVNYLGHYVLNMLLHPLMGKGTRIVSMVSLSYRWFGLKPGFMQLKTARSFNRFIAYSNSKRALYYFTLKAAEQWKDEGICINVADPGIVNTGIICQGNKVIDFLCNKLFRPLINTPVQGAATMLEAALNPAFDGVTGCYFKKKTIAKQSRRFTGNVKEQSLLAEETEKALKEKDFLNLRQQ